MHYTRQQPKYERTQRSENPQHSLSHSIYTLPLICRPYASNSAMALQCRSIYVSLKSTGIIVWTGDVSMEANGTPMRLISPTLLIPPSSILIIDHPEIWIDNFPLGSSPAYREPAMLSERAMGVMWPSLAANLNSKARLAGNIIAMLWRTVRYSSP